MSTLAPQLRMSSCIPWCDRRVRRGGAHKHIIFSHVLIFRTRAAEGNHAFVKLKEIKTFARTSLQKPEWEGACDGCIVGFDSQSNCWSSRWTQAWSEEKTHSLKDKHENTQIPLMSVWADWTRRFPRTEQRPALLGTTTDSLRTAAFFVHLKRSLTRSVCWWAERLAAAKEDQVQTCRT